MLSLLEKFYPSSPHPLSTKKMSFTQCDLEKFKKISLTDLKSDTNRSSLDTQESYEKESIISKSSSSSKKIIQKQKKKSKKSSSRYIFITFA